MVEHGTYPEVLNWLEHQLHQLDDWRSDIADNGAERDADQLRALDCHRDWLAGELLKLSAVYPP